MRVVLPNRDVRGKLLLGSFFFFFPFRILFGELKVFRFLGIK